MSVFPTSLFNSINSFTDQACLVLLLNLCFTFLFAFHNNPTWHLALGQQQYIHSTTNELKIFMEPAASSTIATWKLRVDNVIALIKLFAIETCIEKQPSLYFSSHFFCQILLVGTLFSFSLREAQPLTLQHLHVYMLWFNFILGSNFISFVSNSLSSNYHNQNKGNKI